VFPALKNSTRPKASIARQKDFFMNEWLAAHGGFVGLGVLAAKYILIGFSIASIAVIVERLWTLRQVRLTEVHDYPLVRLALLNEDRQKIHALSEGSEAPCASVLSVGMKHIRSTEARLREATQGEMNARIDALAHNLPILATAASTAPYVGLFGTVLGILAAFRDIAQTGQTGANVIAGSISEALTSTALGLGVAIPAVMAYNYFSSRIHSLGSLIEINALDVSERVVNLSKKTQGGTGASS
jgi:biopolymer transport protein ExbB/TolQ